MGFRALWNNKLIVDDVNGIQLWDLDKRAKVADSNEGVYHSVVMNETLFAGMLPYPICVTHYSRTPEGASQL